MEGSIQNNSSFIPAYVRVYVVLSAFISGMYFDFSVSCICRLNEKSFSNGDVYIGRIKGILPHGKGKYTWSDGIVYEGDWEEGKMTGRGLITWPSGGSYEGEFSGGYLHGHGTFRTSTASIYSGGWRMNAQHGVGRKEYSNSDL